MATVFKLYQSDGTTPQHTFNCIFQANYPHTDKHLIELENVRAKGSIIVDGGTKSWDLTLRGVLTANDYDSLTDLLDTVETNVALNTRYVLKIESATNTYSYNVKRISPIEWDATSLRTNFIEYSVTFRVNSW